MPISKSKQNWTPGETVKVGFLLLTVQKIIPTPGDYKPDKYILADRKGQQYEFTPHHGLSKLETIRNFG